MMTAGLVSDEFAGKLISGEACFTHPEFVATLETVKSWQNAGYLIPAKAGIPFEAMRREIPAYAGMAR